LPGNTFSWLYDVPGVFASVTELAASNTCRKAVVADTDGFVLEGVGKVVFALGHGTNEDADALVGSQCVNIISHPDNLGVEAQGDLAAVGWQMICNGVFDDFEQLLLRIDRSNG